MKLTFYTLDDDDKDTVLGTVTWDGKTADASDHRIPFLGRVAKSINESNDPQAEMQDMGRRYNSVMLRAKLES